jgi:hypothetical protein
MFAQRDEAHNAGEPVLPHPASRHCRPCARPVFAGVLSVVRVFIGSGVPVHVSCATGSPDTGKVPFDAAQRTSDATAAAIALALAGTGTPSTRVVGVPLTPRASARWVT